MSTAKTTNLSPGKLALLDRLLEEEGLERSEQPIPKSTLLRNPLSYTQQRLWFLDHLTPGVVVYNIPCSLLLEGSLDISAMELSLNEVVRRHDSLRTQFRLGSNAEGEQIVLPEIEIALAVIQVEGDTREERWRHIRELTQTAAGRTFDLSKAPLFDAQLLRESEQVHVLLFTVHHIIFDGWSQGVLIEELHEIYSAHVSNRKPSLPALPIQYTDYAAWQRHYLQDAPLEKQMAYWRKQLSQMSGVLELPVDHPRPPVQSYRGSHLRFKFASGLSGALEKLARKERATTFMVLLASLQVLLSRYSGQADIAIGTPVANRTRPETEKLIGFFANTLVMRTEVRAEDSFRELLRRVREVALGAYANQDVPFEKLVEELKPERDLSRSPLFQVMLVLQNASLRPLVLPGLKLSTLNSETLTAKFDLLFGLEQLGDGFSGSVEYNTDLYEAETIERMVGHWEELLRSIVAGPEQQVGELGLLSAAERRQIVEEWNATGRDYSRQQTLADLFEEQVRRTPQREALVYERERLTYQELNRRSNEIAHELQRRGAGAETLIGVCLERSVELVVALLGVLKAGAAYVPLDPSYPAERLGYMVADAGARLILTSAAVVQRIPELRSSGAETICLPPGGWGSAAENPPRQTSGENLAYVIYTSGSTGKPKGAMNRHAGICNRLQWMQEAYGLGEQDRVLQKTPFSFDVSVWEFFWPLLIGARLVLAAPGGHRSSQYLKEVIQSEAITTIHFVPSLLQAFVEEPGIEQCRSLRRVLCSGEALGWELQEQFWTRLGTAELHNLYGPTEASVDVTCWQCRQGEPKGSVPLGRPIANTQIYILDHAGELVPVGVAGELCIGGAGLGRGYWRRPDLTAERFVPDGCSGRAGARLYRTGDRARWRADGVLEYLGRIDHQVKLRGQRIELGEIESVLAGYDGVREAVVVVRNEGGDNHLVAYLVWRAEAERDRQTVQQYLREKLPDYMVPAQIVSLEALPLTPNGKLDRKSLPAPQWGEPDSYTAPRTETEAALARIWEEVLKRNQVGIDDNFFSLGGDSIRSIQVRARAERAGLHFTVEDVFRYPTIRQLVTHLGWAGEQVRTEPFGLLSPQDRQNMPAGVEDAYPLAALQMGMLFHRELAPEEAVYHNVNSYQVRGVWQRPQFQEALRLVTARHPALRTAFDLHSYSEPLQLVYRESTFPFQEYDLRGLPAAEQEQILSQFVEQEKSRHFDLRRPSQVRFTVHRRTSDTFQFTFAENHAVEDGWSLYALINETFEYYLAMVKGTPVPVRPPMQTTYRDFVSLERRALASPEHRQFWLDFLDGHVVAPLPSWSASGYASNPSERVAVVDIPIPKTLIADLRQLAKSIGVPLRTVCLAAHMKVMSVVTNTEDLLSGLVTHGRPETSDGEQIIGLFLTTLPFRQKVNSGTWKDLILDTFATERKILPHRRYPLALIQRSLESGDLWDHYFNYTHFYNVEDLVVRSEDIEFLGGFKYEQTTYPLLCNFTAGFSAELYLEIYYDTSRIPAEQVELIYQYFMKTFTSMVKDSSSRHDACSLLSASEHRQILTEWNRTEEKFSGEGAWIEVFERNVRDHAQDVAAVCQGQELTYAALNDRASQIAWELQRRTVSAEAIVAILLERSLDFLSAVIGIWKAGGAYLPLNPADPPARLRQLVTESGAVGVVIRPGFESQAQSIFAGIPEKSRPWVLNLDKNITDGECAPLVAASTHPHQLAYVIYTSGSTGAPKGVIIEQRGMLNHVFAKLSDLNIRAEDTVAQNASQTFDISVWQFFAPLLVGGRIEILPTEVARDPQLLWAAVRNGNVSILEVVPSFLSALLDELEADPQLRKCRLRYLLLTGETVSPELCRRWLEIFPHVPIVNAYGPTECSDDVTHALVSAPPAPEDRIVPLGRPVCNTQIYILDKDLNPAPFHARGELYVGGVGVGRGYLNRPELTAQAFLPDPFSNQLGQRLYKTGDRALFRRDGVIEFHGRLDEQIKIRGFRIEPAEIAAALSSHPAVKTAVVVGRSESLGSNRLVAYLVFNSGVSKPSVNALKEFLADRLPAYFIPDSLVELESLPLTANGKVDFRSLPDPGSRLDAQETETTFRAPLRGIQEIVAQIWSDTLGVGPLRLEDNFFEIGGHSLLATQVVSRVREAFQIPLLLRTLFDHPTVEEFSHAIENVLRGPRALVAEPILQRAEGTRAPLSFAQQRLWFLDQLNPNSPAYNLSSAIQLDGPLNIDALRRSLNAVIARQHSLRTQFGADPDGTPFQSICPHIEIDLPVTQLENQTDVDLKSTVEALAAEEAGRPFELSRAPLMRVRLLRVDDTKHFFLFTIHHIISDGWSQGVFVDEVARFYSAFAQGQEAPLPELPIQYADFAAWQRDWLQGDVLEQQLAYWRAELGDSESVLDLPTDFPRPAIQTFDGSTRTLSLSSELLSGVRELSRRENATLFMTLLAAFQVLLSKYTGQHDIAVGTPIANRTRRETERIIGFFVNTLVIRNSASPDTSFRSLLKKLREIALGAYAHQDVPFEKLVEELQPERDLARSPLFQVMFALENANTRSLNLPDLQLSYISADTKTAKFDLSLSLLEDATEMTAMVEYNTGLFAPATVDRLLRHYVQLLRVICASPDLPLSEMLLMDGAEIQQTVSAWSGDYSEPVGLCAHEIFQLQAELRPDKIALRYGERSLSYSELNFRANQLAFFLRSRDLSAESLVGISIEPSLELVVAVLGVLKAGCAYLPLDPTYPEERLAYIRQDAQLSFVLDRETWPATDHLPVDNPPPARPDRLAYTIYTSGSTGQPKGVAIDHRALVNFLSSMRQTPGISSTDRLLAVTTLSFDIAALELLLPLSAGAEVIIAPRETSRNGHALAALIVASGPSIMQATPSTWMMLLEAGWQGSPNLKMLCGGEQLTPELASRLLPSGASLWNMYGPTETTIWSSVARIRSAEIPISIGAPISNTHFLVLDKDLQLMPEGLPGELYIGGTGVARGYKNRPGLTAERFIPDLYAQTPGGRLYKTGDLVRVLPGRVLSYLGRSDSQIKLRGYRIELGEIETVLRSLPGIRDCAVSVRTLSHDNQYLVAYFVGIGHSGTSALREQLQQKLPLHMIPAWFVELDRLPLLPNGKLDRRALPQPDEIALRPSDQETSIENPTEEILAGIWSQLLSVGSISATDNFFDLGGHSLLATRLVSRIRQIFGVDLPLRSVFEEPTIAGLARLISQPASRQLLSRTARIPVRQYRERAPLSYQQQRLWFLDQLEPNSPAYNLFSAVKLEGLLDLSALNRAFNAVIARHESLRTRFEDGLAGMPEQVILPELHLEVPMLDADGNTPEEKWAAVSMAANEEGLRPFNLGEAPLLRVIILRVSAHEHVLLCTVHHIVSDAWSQNLLVREIAEYYRAFTTHSAAVLPQLSIQYADYAEWQQQSLTSADLDQQLAYWRHQLGDSHPLDLPSDFPRPARQSNRGARRQFVLDASLVGDVKQLARRENATLHMVLTGALSVLLAKLSRNCDISIGTPVAHRTSLETEGTIGLFVNTLVLRTRLRAAESFRDLLLSVRDTSLNAFANQDIPFEKVVAELQPERDLSRSPLFQVMFSLQNTPRGRLDWPGLSVSTFAAEQSVSKFDLTFFLEEDGEQITGSLEYSLDLFLDSTAERIIHYWMGLLRDIVQNPEKQIGQISLLSRGERRQILEDWNDTAAELNSDIGIVALFEAQVRKTPDAVALRLGSQQLTFRELNEHANRLAHYLIQRGAGAEQLIGICMERSFDMIVALWGTLKCGAAYVPIDSDYPPERIQFMLRDAGIRFLITQKHLLNDFPVSDCERLNLDSMTASVSSQSCENPDVHVDSSNLVYVIYTSGSTGWPKGVMITHFGMINYLRWAIGRYQPCPNGSALATSLSFDLTVTSLFLPLLTGAPVSLAAPNVNASEFATLLAAGNRFSLLKLTPAHLDFLGNSLTQEHLAGAANALVIGGEALRYESLSELRFAAPDMRLINEYGPTETVVGCCVYEVQSADPFEGGVPIGRPIANTQLYLLDESLEPVPPGVPAEIFIAGSGLARGYLQRPDLTAVSFVPDPYAAEPGRRMYKTGDLAKYQPDGNIEFLGRIDDQVKIRGYRIELGEIESVLLQYDGVRRAAVVVREKGGANKSLVAYVELDPGAEQPSARQWKDYLRARLPDYMVPSPVVHIPNFPLTPNGKLDRKSLPEPEQAFITSSVLLPRDELEMKLTSIWEELLEVAPIGRRDNFFDLGGHSFLAVSLMSKIQEELGQKLPVSVLFEEPTIEHLSSLLRKGRTEQRSPIVSIQPKGSKPPLFFVHAISGGALCYLPLSRSLSRDQPFYGLQAVFDEDRESGFALSIERRAELYIAAMRQIQPEGPYLLGGWSFGGYVAYEMAQQLHRANLEVRLLALLDIEARTQSDESPLELSDADLLLEIARDGLQEEELAFDSLLEQANADPERKLETILEALTRSGAVPPDVRLDHVQRFLAGYRNRIQSLKDYRLAPYPGTITLIRALEPGPPSDADSALLADPALGWGALGGQPIRVCHTPGSHRNMIYPPHAQHLGELLSMCTEDANVCTGAHS